MKLAVINSVAGFGSTGKLVSMLAGTEGMQSRIYYGRKEGTSGHDSVKITGTAGFLSHVMHTFLFDDHAFFNTKETLKMVEDLKVFSPDLIHLHNLHGYYMNVEPLFAYLKESGVPVIWTLHDCWAFTGHCAHYTSVGCQKWKTACENCPALLHYPPTFNKGNTEKNRQRKERVFTSLRPDQMTIVTPSEWLKEEAEQSFLSRYTIKAIPNGIDDTIFCRRSSEFRSTYDLNDRFVILAAAGNWYKEKGSEDLVRLANKLPEGTSLVAVGVNSKLKTSLNIPNVIALERTENAKQLAETYSAADVFINLTQEDTFPTVNIEAQACGCPVVTYNVGGSPEIMTKETGMSVPAGNLEEMIHVIEAMRDKQVVFNTAACIERGSQFTRERMLNEYRELYNWMISKQKR